MTEIKTRTKSKAAAHTIDRADFQLGGDAGQWPILR